VPKGRRSYRGEKSAKGITSSKVASYKGRVVLGREGGAYRWGGVWPEKFSEVRKRRLGRGSTRGRGEKHHLGRSREEKGEKIDVTGAFSSKTEREWMKRGRKGKNHHGEKEKKETLDSNRRARGAYKRDAEVIQPRELRPKGGALQWKKGIEHNS